MAETNATHAVTRTGGLKDVLMSLKRKFIHTVAPTSRFKIMLLSWKVSVLKSAARGNNTCSVQGKQSTTDSFPGLGQESKTDLSQLKTIVLAILDLRRL